MLMHAEWGGRAAIDGAVVLDVFAGTGALGLEALSRGATSACFIEQDAAALRALRTNVATCRAEGHVQIVAADVFRVTKGSAASLVFLDPPYGESLVPRAIGRLREVGRIVPGALIIAETGREEIWVPEEPLLAERQHGAARVLIFRGS